MITVENVSKRYQGREVLSDISFTAAPGAVTGFLGPNGAGKTTTMRILLGLTRATSGRALIDGQRMRDLPNAGRTVGVLLDARALSPSRTGRENLVLAGMTMGLGPIDTRTALERVGLTRDAGEKRVGAYSLGMRQRLGIAQALLGDPHVIILDEPVNGLDPSGILWMRRLLRELADEGRTVLLSSHLIHEVERIADHIVLINRGAIVTAGQVDEIIGEFGARVVTPHATQLVAALERRGIDVIAHDGDVVVAATEPEVAATIAFSEQILLHEVSARSSRSLEDRFFELTAAEETA